jgi:ATP-dependent exoDNAse (exonuclease V) beta subunit
LKWLRVSAFLKPATEQPILAYVALTRARKVLDLGGYADILRQSLANARALRAPATARPRPWR